MNAKPEVKIYFGKLLENNMNGYGGTVNLKTGEETFKAAHFEGCSSKIC